MNRDDIIRMAAEIWNAGSEFPIPSSDDIILFASKVAEAEREVCAQVCEQIGKHGIITQCVNAIRARGQA